MSDLAGFARLALLAAALGCIASAARAEIIYDATGGAENGGDPTSVAGPVLADRFLAPATGSLASVSLNLASTGPAGSGFTVDVFTDAGSNGPGTPTLIATVADASLTPAFALTTFTPSGTIALAAGTVYWVGIIDASFGSPVLLGNTLDAAVLSRPSVLAGAFYFNNGGVQANSFGPYEIAITETASPVPEPAGWAAMIGGAAVLGIARRRRQPT